MKRMKLVCLALVGFFSNLSAQTEGSDIVYLKSGEQFIGTIIEQKPGAHIRLLQLPSNDTLTIGLSDIDKMVKRVPEISSVSEPIQTDEKIEVLPENHPYNLRPFYFSLDGFAVGGDFACAGFGAMLFKTINSKLQIGLGANYFAMNIDQEPWRGPRNFIPVTVEGRYAFQEMWNRKSAMVVGVNCGYNFILQGEHELSGISAEFGNGFYFQPSLGWRINFTSNVGMVLEVSYQNLSSKSINATTEDFIKKNNWSNIMFGGSIFF